MHPNEAALTSTNTELGLGPAASTASGGRAGVVQPELYLFATHADAKDVIWVGTWGGGVSRYEEGEWRNLSMTDGLAGNIVYSIAQDDSGAYWFGTNRGVGRRRHVRQL